MKNQIVRNVLLLLFVWTNTEAQISGIVFRDFNSDGVKVTTSSTAYEPGVPGVQVTAYPSSGSVQTTTTDASGNYTFSGLTLPVRIEFSGFALSDYSAAVGTNSFTSVQFYTAATTSANLGINTPSHYSQASPRYITPKYLNGDPLNPSGTGANDPALFSFPFNATGKRLFGGTAATTVATQAQIGSAWGVAYSQTRKKLFVSSVYKRHAPLGPGETGGRIFYVDNPATAPGTPTKLVDLVSDLSINVGSILSNSARGLPANKDLPSRDDAAFSSVGKVSLGDLDISEDEKNLFVVNLFDRKVYKIDIDLALAGTPNASPLPDFIDPACSNGVARPWGLGFWGGELYLGIVCTAENAGSTANLMGYVQKFNFSTNSWTTVLSYPLNYLKGFEYYTNYAGWSRWTNNFNEFKRIGSGNIYTAFYPQPIIGDIEFDEEGSMQIAMLDRAGFQLGHRNYLPNVTNDSLALGVTGGDLLRTYKNPSTGIFALESAGVSGPYTTGGTGTLRHRQGGPVSNQGPGGGEFYPDDFTGDATQGYHSETTSGGLAFKKGTRILTSVQMDPVDGSTDAQGVAWFSSVNGLQSQTYELFSDFSAPYPDFNKQNGLGDIELLADPAPIEIGNRVWNDTDRDGVQDPGEATLSGVTVQLVKSGSVIATAVTNSTGNYYFSNASGMSTTSAIYNITQLMANMEYTVRIPNVTGGSKQSALGNLRLTTNGTGGAGQPDVRDSDGTLVGLNADATVLTTDIPISGANNHSFDFGFMACPDTSYLICNNGIDSVKLTADAGVTNVMWYDSTSNTLVGTGSMLVVKSTTTGMSDGYEAYYYTATMPDGCQGLLCCPVRVKTQTCITCSASVSQVTTQCNNNNTPANSSDDWFSVTLTGTISMGSGNYVVKVGAYTSPVTPSGTAITITGNGLAGNPLFQANGTSTYTLRIEDANDSSCFTTTTVGPINACSSCPSPNCKTVTVTKS